MKTIRIKQRNGIAKFLTAIAFLGFIGLSTTSCDDSPEYIYSDILYVGRATAIPNGSGFSLQTDGGRSLSVVSSLHDGYRPEENQRVFVKYSVMDKEEGTEKYKVNLYDIKNILTKNIADLTVENDAQFGNDPVRVYDVWCAGGFLNVNFGFNYGGAVTHTVNLVNNRTAAHPDDGKIYLEFRHNAFDDAEEVARLGTVCFNLKPYEREDGQPVTFVFKFHEFGTDSSYEIKYDFRPDGAAEQGLEEHIGGWGYE